MNQLRDVIGLAVQAQVQQVDEQGYCLGDGQQALQAVLGQNSRGFLCVLGVGVAAGCLASDTEIAKQEHQGHNQGSRPWHQVDLHLLQHLQVAQQRTLLSGDTKRSANGVGLVSTGTGVHTLLLVQIVAGLAEQALGLGTRGAVTEQTVVQQAVPAVL